eukprot:5258756-Heterocapsa_arctica.AAC.1
MSLSWPAALDCTGMPWPALKGRGIGFARKVVPLPFRVSFTTGMWSPRVWYVMYDIGPLAPSPWGRMRPRRSKAYLRKA